MTREEAIETIKRNCTEGSQLREACAMFIPELAESEDEKFARIVLDLPFKHEADYKFVRAHLEKQKEPLPIPDKFSGLKSLMLQYLQSAANRKDDTEIESDTDLWCRKILDYVWKYSDEQKEQKPAEWSEEDIKKIRSEEYTKGFNDAAFGGKLKEWSEEDERMLSRCIKSIECSKIFAETNTFKEAKDKEIDWLIKRLKSLRPSWKPSAEQMEALKVSSEYESCIKNREHLKSLYDELKKL